MLTLPGKLLAGRKGLWLLEIIVCPETETADIYVPMLADGQGTDSPLMIDGYILALLSDSLVFEGIGSALTLPSEIDYYADERQAANVVQSLYLLEHEDIDEKRWIIDCLNYYDDLLIALNRRLPAPYYKPINEFAIFLTSESSSILDFVTNSNVSRQVLVDGLIWMNGAVFSSLHIIK